MLRDIDADTLAAKVTELMYARTLELSRALGATLGKPRTPRVAAYVRMAVEYAQRGSELPNDQVVETINSLIDLLSTTCYPPATLAARQIFDRRAGEPATDIETVLLAARARWDIELDMYVPIRWLATLGGVSVKTARNLASAGELVTQSTTDGQVAIASESARWLATRGLDVIVGCRRKRGSLKVARRQPHNRTPVTA